MDLPQQDEKALRSDLENIARLNGAFGGRRAVEKIFHQLAGSISRLVLVDLAAGYGDHGRNLIAKARARQREVAVVAIDFQFQTLRIAREATPSGAKMFFVQADARRLPFRDKGADLAFCSLALHHFAEEDALTVLREMARVSRRGLACADLVRSRLAAFGVWLLTTLIVRDPMVRHDARLSIRRAFTARELTALARRAGWPGLRQINFLWFQQAILARLDSSFHT
ncbi:MAG TPA: methyltransferase domain-containing protein [Candidatus Methylacidiphilales bacterium]|nr:methyltransferase domain-containing protein [Candidatus Methylacidiphilales bacterium]